MKQARVTPEDLESLRQRAEEIARSQPSRLQNFYREMESMLPSRGVDFAWKEWIIGSTLHLVGKTAEALPRLKRASRIFRSRGFEHEAARVDLALLDAFVCRGNFRSARARGLRALEVFKKLRDRPRMVSTMLNFGGMEDARNRIDAALSWWLKARSLVEEGDFLRRALIETSIAGAFMESGAFREAEMAAGKAIELFEESGSLSTAILPKLSLAEIAGLRGETGKALKFFTEAESRATRCGDENLLAAARLARGELELETGQFEKVLEMASGMRDRAEKLGRLDDLARFAALEARAALAAESPGFEKKIAEAGRLLRDHVGREASALFRVRMAAFRPHFTSAELNSDWKLLRKNSLLVAADVARISAAEAAFREGNAAEARKTAEELLRKRRLLPGSRIRAHRLLSRMDRDPNPSQAIRHLQTLLKTAESIRGRLFSRRDRELFGAMLAEDYALLVSLYLRRGDARSRRLAFEAVSRVKSRGLVEALDEGSDSIVGSDPEIARRWESLRKELRSMLAALEKSRFGQGRFSGGALARRVHSLSRELEGLEAEAARRRSDEPVLKPPSSLAGLLEEGEYFLEAFFAGEDLFLFLLSRNILKVQRIPSCRKDCEHEVDQLRFQLSRVAYGRQFLEAAEAPLLRSVQVVLSSLGHRLLGPISALGSIQRLWISPHGVLHHIPMAALEYEGEALIDRCPVAVVPGSDILARILARPNPRPGHLGVAGAATDELPEIAVEVEEISRSFRRVRKSPAAGVQEIQEMLAECDAVHIASHGAFHASAAASSGFRLSDGWLTAADLLRQPPKARMMSCGVCASGEVEVRPGEETMGVIRALLAGGVSTALVAPGVLDDRIARKAARIFYDEVFVSGPGLALRSTLRKLRREHPHPALWAGLQLYGNARPWGKVA